MKACFKFYIFKMWQRDRQCKEMVLYWNILQTFENNITEYFRMIFKWFSTFLGSIG